MAQLIEALRWTAAKWRAGNQEHREGVVLVWDRKVYGCGRMNWATRPASAQVRMPWTRPG